MPVADPPAAGTYDISIEGIRLRYHVFGSGPACVIHSGGPGVEWRYLRMPRLETHLTCVYLEPIGTTGSGRLPQHPNDYTVELYSNFLHGLIDRLGLPKLYLLGHSHGGFVAQRYALDHADRLAGLILYSTTPVAGGELRDEASRQIEAFARRFHGNPEVDAVVDAWRSVGRAKNDEGATKWLQAMFPAYFADYWGRVAEFGPARDTINVSYIARIDDGPLTFDVRGRLGEIAAPTLVISGQYDFICGMRWARQLHDGISGSELLVLPDSGHFGHLEEPERLAEGILRFVRPH